MENLQILYNIIEKILPHFAMHMEIRRTYILYKVFVFTYIIFIL